MRGAFFSSQRGAPRMPYVHPSGFPPRWPASRYVFRAFRSFIKTRAALAKHIKDLKDLRILRVRAGYRHSGPKGPEEQDTFFCVNDGEGNPLACTCGMRGPKPYGEGGLSAAAAPGSAPPYCIETGRSLLPGRNRDMKHPQLSSFNLAQR